MSWKKSENCWKISWFYFQILIQNIFSWIFQQPSIPNIFFASFLRIFNWKLTFSRPWPFCTNCLIFPWEKCILTSFAICSRKYHKNLQKCYKNSFIDSSLNQWPEKNYKIRIKLTLIDFVCVSYMRRRENLPVLCLTYETQ